MSLRNDTRALLAELRRLKEEKQKAPANKQKRLRRHDDDAAQVEPQVESHPNSENIAARSSPPPSLRNPVFVGTAACPAGVDDDCNIDDTLGAAARLVLEADDESQADALASARWAPTRSPSPERRVAARLSTGSFSHPAAPSSQRRNLSEGGAGYAHSRSFAGSGANPLPTPPRISQPLLDAMIEVMDGGGELATAIEQAAASGRVMTPQQQTALLHRSLEEAAFSSAPSPPSVQVAPPSGGVYQGREGRGPSQTVATVAAGSSRQAAPPPQLTAPEEQTTTSMACSAGGGVAVDTVSPGQPLSLASSAALSHGSQLSPTTTRAGDGGSDGGGVGGGGGDQQQHSHISSLLLLQSRRAGLNSLFSVGQLALRRAGTLFLVRLASVPWPSIGARDSSYDSEPQPQPQQYTRTTVVIENMGGPDDDGPSGGPDKLGEYVHMSHEHHQMQQQQQQQQQRRQQQQVEGGAAPVAPPAEEAEDVSWEGVSHALSDMGKMATTWRWRSMARAFHTLRAAELRERHLTIWKVMLWSRFLVKQEERSLMVSLFYTLKKMAAGHAGSSVSNRPALPAPGTSGSVIEYARARTIASTGALPPVDGVGGGSGSGFDSDRAGGLDESEMGCGKANASKALLTVLYAWINMTQALRWCGLASAFSVLKEGMTAALIQAHEEQQAKSAKEHDAKNRSAASHGTPERGLPGGGGGGLSRVSVYSSGKRRPSGDDHDEDGTSGDVKQWSQRFGPGLSVIDQQRFASMVTFSMWVRYLCLQTITRLRSWGFFQLYSYSHAAAGDAGDPTLLRALAERTATNSGGGGINSKMAYPGSPLQQRYRVVSLSPPFSDSNGGSPALSPANNDDIGLPLDKPSALVRAAVPSSGFDGAASNMSTAGAAMDDDIARINALLSTLDFESSEQQLPELPEQAPVDAAEAAARQEFLSVLLSDLSAGQAGGGAGEGGGEMTIGNLLDQVEDLIAMSEGAQQAQQQSS